MTFHFNPNAVRRARPGWRFFFLWMMLTVAGTTAYAIIVIPLMAQAFNIYPQPNPVHFEQPTVDQMKTQMIFEWISAVITGAVIGLGEWLILRKYLNEPGLWILATMIGYLPATLRWGFPMRETELGAALTLGLYGAFLGMLQWIVG